VIELALSVVAATLVVGFAAVLALRALPTVRLQLAGLAALAVLVPLTAVLLSGWVMFHMGADVKILAVATASATAAIAAALVLARSISNSIERVRAASAELARGELGARAPEDGPAEVAELAASFNEMAGNLEELFDARRQLVAWASHDLRTPLASMQAMLEALEDGLAEPEQYLPALQDQVRTLGTLVDDLFELARIDAGALTLELHDARLDGLVENCLRSLAAEATAKHVSLQSRCDGSAGPVRCAPDKVERVLFNLLTNALRHTPSDGSVAVLVAPEGSEEVRVTVEDTGEGIPAEALRRVFDRFWRGDLARTRASGGSGLGLAIARGLVEAQGGRIWAEARPSGGARVCFTLPAA
jgi:two-component system, OmpR family, sensor histidine kinase SaeS